MNRFLDRLEQRRASTTRPLLDLTETDPARCGLGWDPAEIESLLAGVPGETRDEGRAHARAQDAIASYLAGRGVRVPPDQIELSPTREDGLELALETLCGDGDEILLPSPSRFLYEGLPALPRLRVGTYPLLFDGAWRIDRRALARAVTPRTRAIVMGNPSEPTGALLSREELAFVEGLCAARDLVLVGDEALADTALDPHPSVLEAKTCLAVHLAGCSGVCGLPRVGGEWFAAAGPEALVAAFLSRVRSAVGRDAPSRAIPEASARAMPGLLARRESFLTPLRARLAGNRASLATAALAESAFSLQWGRGGWSAVVQVDAVEPSENVCLALLGDDVIVHPGPLHGLPDAGYLVVSLLPEPAVFREGISRLDRRLRAPISRDAQ